MRRICYVFGILSLLAIVGCTDKLGMLDWSGQIALKPSNNDWAYREIFTKQINPFSLNPANKLGDFQNEILAEKVIPIGNGEYLIKSRFDNGKISIGNDIIDILLKTDQFTTYGPFGIAVLDINNKQKLELITVKEYETGDPWKTKIEDSKSDSQTIVLERKGDFSYYFKVPDIPRNFMITASYQIKSKVDRKVDQNGKLVKTDNHYEYSALSVTGSSSINIGLTQCLAGSKMIEKQEVKFYVLDWNLDGQFTEDDVVWSNYTNKTYEFGKPIRLTNSWGSDKDNTYQLKLVKPKSENDPYAIEIKLISKGKR